MKRPLKERAVSAALIVPTAVVVVALAALQYRWSNEASEATAVRLADTLQLSMVNWHLDFFRNFSEVCVTGWVDVEHGAGNGDAADVSQYIRRFSEWKAVARYPDLVRNVYLATLDPAADPPILRLNQTARQFEPDAWPVWLADLRDELERAQEPVASADSSDISDQPFADSLYNLRDVLRGWRFEPSVPALLYPITHRSGAESPPVVSDPIADWMVVELNATVIEDRILPDLAHRYFQGTDGLDYQVAVVTGRPPRRIIYSSDSSFGGDEVPDADGTMDVFGRVLDQTLGSPMYVFHKPSENRGPTAALGISWFPLLRDVPEVQDWQLVVRHRRGGPLGAFVVQMHRRDLAISFGALLLLVVSMAMLIITSTRAQRLAKLQMDFVTAVSHELRTPLTVISSAADNIAHGVVEGKEQVKQYGSVIGEQVRRLSGLVEEVLLFATTREDHQRYSLRPLDVSEIVDATLASTEGLIHAAHFTVERDVEPGLPKVTGDLLALSQCLQNLITNALKYGKDQRWIGIRARVADREGGGREVQVSVSDRGIGIDSSDLPHIFEPFYRSPTVAAASIHGTGLGLSLAQRIAEAMKGRLSVSSTLGRGTTFTLHLPCLEPQGRTAMDQEGEIGAVVPILDSRATAGSPRART